LTHTDAQQAGLCKKNIDYVQNLFGQFMPPQPVTKTKGGCRIRQATKRFKLSKLPVLRSIKEAIFHDQIG
jgi:hypothetical protein